MKLVSKKRLVRLLLACESGLVAAGCSAALRPHGVELVGAVKRGSELTRRYAEQRPDVVFISVDIGDRNLGLDAVRDLLRTYPEAKILALGSEKWIYLCKECYRLGARAFVSHSCDAQELARAIHHANLGELYFMPQIAERLASLSVLGEPSPRELLNEREFEVFKMMALGFTPREMAGRLCVSLKSISAYSMGIKRKFQTDRIAELTLIAIRYGVIEV